MAEGYLESCEYFIQCRIPAEELGLGVRGQNQLHLPFLQPQEGERVGFRHQGEKYTDKKENQIFFIYKEIQIVEHLQSHI
jgi:hypothetical protein